MNKAAGMVCAGSLTEDALQNAINRAILQPLPSLRRANA